MPVDYKNLSGHVQAALSGGYPDIGQIHYLIDSDFRTAAQGWTRADGTGPLDLHSQRNPGYTFFTPGTGQANASWATDAAAVQAAVDATIDFRGDTLYATPGSYSIAVAINLNSANMRLLGSPRGAARPTSTFTGTIADTFAIAAAAIEVGFLRFVPLTATALFTAAASADGLWFHDFYWDTSGVGTSAATDFINFDGSCDDCLLERLVIRHDDLQGVLVTLETAADNLALTIQDFVHTQEGGTTAVSVLDIDSNGVDGVVVTRGKGLIGSDGVVTSMAVMVDQETDSAPVLQVSDFIGTIGYCASTALVVAAVAAEANLYNCWLCAVQDWTPDTETHAVTDAAVNNAMTGTRYTG